MSKPIIGIVAKPLLKSQIPKSLWKRLVINDEFRQLIVDNGGIPLGIIPNRYQGNADTSDIIEKLSDQELEDLLQTVKLCNGIILQGGLTSDTYEIEIAKYCIEHNIPMIGICAGFNNIARALDIKVKYKPELVNHDIYTSEPVHNVIVANTDELKLILNNNEVDNVNHANIKVNSLHQMFIELEDIKGRQDVQVLAISTDDVTHVEMFKYTESKYCIGIKWHPELNLNDEITKVIFSTFINSCRNDN